MYGAPCYVAYRAELRRILTTRIVRGNCAPRSSLRRRNAKQKGRRSRVRSPSGRMLHVEADAAIGADGIYSVIRGFVTSQEEPRFSGFCRSVVLSLVNARLKLRGARCRHCGVPVAISCTIRSQAVVSSTSWRLRLRATGDRSPGTADGKISDMMREFEDWDARLRQLIISATQTKRWGPLHRGPLEQWTAGRIGLLGDAAHAMLPFSRKARRMRGGRCNARRPPEIGGIRRSRAGPEALRRIAPPKSEPSAVDEPRPRNPISFARWA